MSFLQKKIKGLIDAKENCKNSSTVTQIISGRPFFQTAIVDCVSSSEINYIKWYSSSNFFEEYEKKKT